MPEPSVVSVRPARGTDADAIAQIQLSSWRSDGVLPAARIDAVGATELARSWEVSILAPPSPKHHVLVACDGAGVVGVAAVAPSDDADADPDSEAELLALHVDPAHRRAGHGSRLVTAVADTARADGIRTLQHWVGANEDRARMFLTETGFGSDGAHRELDLDGDGAFVVRQVRLHTSIEQENA